MGATGWALGAAKMNFWERLSPVEERGVSLGLSEARGWLGKSSHKR